MVVLTALGPRSLWRERRRERGSPEPWRLATRQTVWASPMRSTIGSRPHLVASIGRAGEVHEAGAYA